MTTLAEIVRAQDMLQDAAARLEENPDPVACRAFIVIERAEAELETLRQTAELRAQAH